MLFPIRNDSPRVVRLLVLGGALSVGAAPVAAASPFCQTAPQSAPSASRQASVTLARALERLSARYGILVVADSTVAFERVASADAPATAATVSAAAATAAPTPEAEAELEKQIVALVRTLGPGTIWGKLYLPLPASGRPWKGDDVAAFAAAQVRLFGPVGAPSADGSVEILGKRVARGDAAPYVAGLGLRPVYLISNPRRQMAALTPWSPATQDQWANMSPDERKQYGQEQAAWIMSLPPEQRDQMLLQIRQHDKYFDTIKDPLEKMLGHDL